MCSPACFHKQNGGELFFIYCLLGLNVMRALTFLVDQLVLIRAVFLAHFLVGMAIVLSPTMVAARVYNRPPVLVDFALKAAAGMSAKQEEMLLLYQRIAASFQVFVGICGTVCGVRSWHVPLALALYDGLHAVAIWHYR